MFITSRTSTLKRLVIRAAILPVFLLIALAGILIWQIQYLMATTSKVEHSDLILTNANLLHRMHVNMETGLRGFLITNDKDFLEPYTRGLEQIPELAKETAGMLADNPEQGRILTEINDMRREWVGYAEDQMQRRQTGGDWSSAVEGGQGKRKMDDIRSDFGELIGQEERLRDIRVADSRRVATQGSWIACGATLIVGTALALLSRRELNKVAATYEEALGVTEALTTQLENRVAERTTALATSNTALTEANKELEAFSYSISHDLRAPLRHIGGFGDLLRISLDGKLSADESENLTTIIDTSKLAGKMVDDLLAFSRIGRAELKREPVDMNELVERCRKELEPEVRGREISWSVAPLPTVEGDPALLKLVMSNLLGNALKYTSKRDVTNIEVTAASNSDGIVTVSVRDNGVGFDEAYSHKLFGVFQRLHRAEDYEGTGIGLANVRRIILRHGGRVWANSRLGEGATFSFSLPKEVTP